MQDFEKLGVFYLGREYDIASRKLEENLILYDSKDLVTHAVCVGMTGSGKTGLCLSLLEEAAIDSIPCLMIDPKGDLANLLLTFPNLKGEDFAPWINADDARRKGLQPADFAKQQAEMWKKGLGEWGQDGARIQRLRDAADFAIYTPGSTAGLPVSIVQSFAVPPEAVLNDPELLRDRINSTATCVLALLNIQADPIQSREHILLSTIFNYVWKQGEDLDLAKLIHHIQTPPVAKVGVMDLESFFPSKARFALAMQINNLIAAPGFEAWLEGEALDIGKMLFSSSGKPRMSIFSIAHLSDSERMFFVTLLMNQALAWMRSQPGTTSLRAILYMDEIFGYFPPVANPPSKTPMLTLLKQARAFGIGMVLATQNPVDLDYKGLSNTGTWFIGRLQTERDKNRVLDGLEGAAADQSAKFDRGKMEKLLASLGNRVFLLHSVHQPEPVVFQTRWALSYLRGPMTRQQIKQLMDPLKSARSADPQAAAPVKSTVNEESLSEQRPLLPPEISQFYVPVRGPSPGAKAKLIYEPMLLAVGQIYWTDSKTGVDQTQDLARTVAVTDDAVAINWENAEETEVTPDDLEKEPAAEVTMYAHLARDAAKAKSYDSWKKGFVDHLYRNQKLDIFKCASLKQVSEPGESERDFRVRLQLRAKEERDEKAEALKVKFAPKFAALEERRRKALQTLEKEKDQAKQSKVASALSWGATIIGAILGRKAITATTVSKATTAAKTIGRASKESQDITMAQDNIEAINGAMAKLEGDFQAAVADIESRIDPMTEELETISIKPKKTNISAKLVALVWMPFWRQEDGMQLQAW